MERSLFQEELYEMQNILLYSSLNLLFINIFLPADNREKRVLNFNCLETVYPPKTLFLLFDKAM